MSVDEERPVVTSEDILDYWKAGVLEDSLLGGSLLEDVVKVQLVYFIIFVMECNAAVDQLQSFFGGLLAHRPYSEVHLYLLLLTIPFE